MNLDLNQKYVIVRKKFGKVEFWSLGGSGYANAGVDIGVFNQQEIDAYIRQGVYVCLVLRELPKALQRHDYVAISIGDYLHLKLNQEVQ